MTQAYSAATREPVVLVVDDDPVFRALMEEVLSARGAGRVICAADGELGLAALADHKNRIDVVTLDLSMPNLDGVRFLRQARELGFAGRLLLISGEHESVVASAGKLASMLGLDCPAVFAKPVDFGAVADVALAPASSDPPSRQRTVDADEIGQGLIDSRLMAHYQPRIDLRSGQVVGAEALARMYDRRGELLDAGRMIDLAEQTGRIGDVTWRMIELVSRDTHELLRQVGISSLKISFNISTLVLTDGEFARQMAEAVRAAGLRPQSFILEVTESRIPTDTSKALEALTLMRMQGFELAIDDFGTGYSNIEQLSMFPFSELKVDKSFMMAASTDSFAAACVEASVGLARELKLRTIAEGIESGRELELARRHDMDEVQGYLFSKPLPFSEFVSFVRANRSDADRAPATRMAS